MLHTPSKIGLPSYKSILYVLVYEISKKYITTSHAFLENRSGSLFQNQDIRSVESSC